MASTPVRRSGGGSRIAHSSMDENLEWVTTFLLIIFGQEGTVCVSVCAEAVGICNPSTWEAEGSRVQSQPRAYVACPKKSKVDDNRRPKRPQELGRQPLLVIGWEKTLTYDLTHSSMLYFREDGK